MDILARSPFQSEISYKNGKIQVIGSTELIATMNQIKNEFGRDPKQWNPLSHIRNANDLLINEFILKCRGEFKLNYEGDELCHCRTVPAEKVYCAIKQGAKTVAEVSRTTLAGTGCGSCRPDIQSLLDQFVIQK